MPAKDNPKVEEQAYRPPEGTHTPDAQRLLHTLDRVFSTFREQLRTETPGAFTGNARIAANTFNDVVAGLKFQSRGPGAITIAAIRESPTEIELRWKDAAPGADGYRVERCEGHQCHDLDEIARLPSTARSFRDCHLSEHTPYRYRVVAFDGRGDTPSNIVQISPGSYGQDNREAR